ncbi:MAG: hypothetical protein ACE37K_21455 [Planctomycetota bacterium]
MHKTLTTGLSALFAALLAGPMFRPTADSAPQPPLLPGPGGVAAAVTTFLERLDQGAGVRPLLDVSAHDLEFVFDDGAMKQAGKGDARVPSFQELGPRGPFAARTTAQFAAQLGKLVATDAGASRKVTTTVDRIRANCQSEACSLATVEFTRRYEVDGAEPVEHQLRATALLRWERNELGDFRIYHWHASRR